MIYGIRHATRPYHDKGLILRANLMVWNSHPRNWWCPFFTSTKRNSGINSTVCWSQRHKACIGWKSSFKTHFWTIGVVHHSQHKHFGILTLYVEMIFVRDGCGPSSIFKTQRSTRTFSKNCVSHTKGKEHIKNPRSIKRPFFQEVSKWNDNPYRMADIHHFVEARGWNQ